MQWVSDLKWVLIALFVALVVKRILGFRPEERLMTVLMFSYFFLVITSFWILKPIKKVVLVGFYNTVTLRPARLESGRAAGRATRQSAEHGRGLHRCGRVFLPVTLAAAPATDLLVFRILHRLLSALRLAAGQSRWSDGLVLLHVRRSVQHSHGCHVLRISQRQRHLRGGKTSVWPHRPRCSSRGRLRQYHGRNLRS